MLTQYRSSVRVIQHIDNEQDHHVNEDDLSYFISSHDSTINKLREPPIPTRLWQIWSTTLTEQSEKLVLSCDVLFYPHLFKTSPYPQELHWTDLNIAFQSSQH